MQASGIQANSSAVLSLNNPFLTPHEKNSSQDFKLGKAAYYELKNRMLQ